MGFGFFENLRKWQVRDRGVVLFSQNGNPLNITTNEYAELRVAVRQTLLDLKMVDLSPNGELVTSYTANGGNVAFDATRSSTFLTTTTAASSRAVFQTKTSPNYQIGKRNNTVAICGKHIPAAGSLLRLGLFTDYDGIFFQRTATEDAFVLRSSIPEASAPDIVVSRTAWNADKLDGSGPTSFNLAPVRAILPLTVFIVFAWPGDVWVGLIINGTPMICHVFWQLQHTAFPLFRTPDLPLRFELVNDSGGAAAGSTMQVVGGSIEVESGEHPLGLPGAPHTPIDGVYFGGAGVHKELISVRLKSGANRCAVPLAGELSCLSPQSGICELLWNATLSGAPNWVDIGGGLEATGVTLGDTYRDVTAEGRIIASSPYNSVSRTADVSTGSFLRFGRTVAGVSDVVTLAAHATGVQTVLGSLSFREIP